MLFDDVITVKSKNMFITYRVVGFSTWKNLEILSKCRKIWLDGTFKCVPKIFEQMITIHGFYENRVWPLVHVLVNSKTTESYNLLFRNLSDVMKKKDVEFHTDL